MSLKIFKDLDWSISEPLSEVRHYDSKLDDLVDIKDTLNRKIKLRPEDRVVILRFCPPTCGLSKELPILTEAIKGDTVGAVMEAYERGLNRPIKPADKANNKSNFYFEAGHKEKDYPNKNEVIYSKIAKWFHSSKRLELVQKYESGQLMPYELYGDRRYFEGVARKGNYLYFYTGS